MKKQENQVEHLNDKRLVNNSANVKYNSDEQVKQRTTFKDTALWVHSVVMCIIDTLLSYYQVSL